MGKLSPVVFGTNVHGRDRYYVKAEVETYKRDHPRLGTLKLKSAV
jgi:hypothetical protein